MLYNTVSTQNIIDKGVKILFIPRKYESKGHQHPVTISLPSKQATFIKKYIKQFNDKRSNLEYSLEDLLTTLVEDFYITERDKTKEQRDEDKKEYQAWLEQEQRQRMIQAIEREQAELEKRKQQLLTP